MSAEERKKERKNMSDGLYDRNDGSFRRRSSRQILTLERNVFFLERKKE